MVFFTIVLGWILERIPFMLDSCGEILSRFGL